MTKETVDMLALYMVSGTYIFFISMTALDFYMNYKLKRRRFEVANILFIQDDRQQHHKNRARRPRGNTARGISYSSGTSKMFEGLPNFITQYGSSYEVTRGMEYEFLELGFKQGSHIAFQALVAIVLSPLILVGAVVVFVTNIKHAFQSSNGFWSTYADLYFDWFISKYSALKKCKGYIKDFNEKELYIQYEISGKILANIPHCGIGQEYNLKNRELA